MIQDLDLATPGYNAALNGAALADEGAAALLEQVSGAALSELRPQHTATIDLAGVPVLVARREPIGGASFTLYLLVEQLDAVRDALVAAGAVPLDADTLDVLRVERGY